MNAIKILIVEDESIAALSLKESLEELGYKVSGLASEGSEALLILKENTTELVLMDINLQEKEEGISLGGRVMEEFDVPVVFLTAYADPATIAKAREVFPYGYMVKPYAEPELHAVIETAIYKHRADKKQRELHQIKDKFYSIIAHDLRSPLAALAFTTRLLNRKADELPAEKMKDFIHEIHQTVENLNQFTENLLEWTRSQSGRLMVYKEDVALKEIINRVFALLKGRANEKEINLRSLVGEEAVVADRNMLHSIILNLVQNSLKFSYPGSLIEIEAVKTGSKIVMLVRDQGIGMNKEQLAHVFDFQKSHHTLGTREEKGTGLGMLLCKEFMDALGGEIDIKSMPGEGTEVKLSLPAVQ